MICWVFRAYRCAEMHWVCGASVVSLMTNRSYGHCLIVNGLWMMGWFCCGHLCQAHSKSTVSLARMSWYGYRFLFNVFKMIVSVCRGYRCADMLRACCSFTVSLAKMNKYCHRVISNARYWWVGYTVPIGAQTWVKLAAHPPNVYRFWDSHPNRSWIWISSNLRWNEYRSWTSCALSIVKFSRSPTCRVMYFVLLLCCIAW